MLTRREALSRFLKYLVTGGLLAIAWGYVKGTRPSWKEVVFSQLPKEKEVVFKDGVYLVGLERGVKAFADTCPHLGCKVDYQPGASRFRCPCHGSEFEINGNKIKGPANKDMVPLDVRAKGGSGKCCVELMSS